MKMETSDLLGSFRTLQTFADNRDALSATDTCSRQSVTSVATPQLEKQSKHESRARRCERMAKSDCAAVNVRLVSIETEFLFHREILRRECFVYFHQIQIRQLQPGLFQRLQTRRHGPDSHDVRFDSGVRPTDNATERLQVL